MEITKKKIGVKMRAFEINIFVKVIRPNRNCYLDMF